MKLNKIYQYNKFLKDKKEWLRQGGEITEIYKILKDYKDPAGKIDTHYFHQDLLVANYISERNPKRHIDIGSRLDGFVAHVAAFRTIEVFDIRPMRKNLHKNIIFKQMDINDINMHEKADSVSCLHAIEHFGLGRYGDNIDINGHKKGLDNLISIVSDGGILYVSFPIGNFDQVVFNAHRIFQPKSILGYNCVSKNLKLINFDYIDDDGIVHSNVNIHIHQIDTIYGCGIYTFQKKKNNIQY